MTTIEEQLRIAKEALAEIEEFSNGKIAAIAARALDKIENLEYK